MKNWKKAGIGALCVMSLLAGCGMQDGKDDGNGGKDDTPMDVTLETLREVNDPCVLLAKYDAVTVNIQGTDRDGEVAYTAKIAVHGRGRQHDPHVLALQLYRQQRPGRG